MMKEATVTKKFNCIAIVGQPRQPRALDTHKMLYHWLKSDYPILVEDHIAKDPDLKGATGASLAEIGQQADLAIVVGGDGNMLRAAQILHKSDIKVIGINRGNLGFLTDLDPDKAREQLSKVLIGEYSSEQRFLLEVEVRDSNQQYCTRTAINEVVLHSAKKVHMIKFEVYIDDCFAFSQRSDGLIIATPTGSTAYSLSAGGPILTSTLDAMVLVPMFPHTLSARPLVMSSSSTIYLKVLGSDLAITCDGHIELPIQKDEEVEIWIRRSAFYLDLIHPKNYCYFNTLNKKLGWSKTLF